MSEYIKGMESNKKDNSNLNKEEVVNKEKQRVLDLTKLKIKASTVERFIRVYKKEYMAFINVNSSKIKGEYEGISGTIDTYMKFAGVEGKESEFNSILSEAASMSEEEMMYLSLFDRIEIFFQLLVKCT